MTKRVVFAMIGAGNPPSVLKVARAQLEPHLLASAALMTCERPGFECMLFDWTTRHGTPRTTCPSPDMAVDILSGLRAIGYEVSAEIVSPGMPERVFAKMLEHAGIRVTVTEVG